MSAGRGSGPGEAVQRLRPCPRQPHCVCSQDEPPSIAPLRIAGDPAAAWERLCDRVMALPRVQGIVRTDQYLHAEFRSRVFGFVDDVELLLDAAAGCIHVRSCSRVGYWDFGANRRRGERLRRLFNVPPA